MNNTTIAFGLIGNMTYDELREFSTWIRSRFVDMETDEVIAINGLNDWIENIRNTAIDYMDNAENK